MAKEPKKKDKFTIIYSDYYPLVFKMLKTKTDNIHDVEDICNTVFMKLFEKLDEIQEPRKWLYTTLNNTYFEHIRYQTKGGNPSEDMDGIISLLGMQYVNGFRDARIIIEEALNNTIEDETDKIIFELVAIDCFSYNQAAKQLGLTQRQVEYRYKEKIVGRIMDYLNKKLGVKSLEELL